MFDLPNPKFFPSWKPNYLINIKEEFPDFLSESFLTSFDSHYRYNLPVIWDDFVHNLDHGELTVNYMIIDKLETYRERTPLSITKPHSPFEGYYPLYYIPGIIIQHLTRIPKHEELLKYNLLIPIKQLINKHASASDGGMYGNYGIEDFSYQLLEIDKDNLFETKPFQPSSQSLNLKKDDIEKEPSYYLDLKIRKIFFSHRWHQHVDTGLATPDDNESTKLAKMKRSVKKEDLVWFDYMCIPQDSQERQLDAIQSLPYYISCSDVVHILTTTEENKEQYKTRAFTNLELVCASLPLLERRIVTGDYTGASEVKITISPLCSVYDEDGSLGFPFLSPHKANLYNPEDLPKLKKVLERIVKECKNTLSIEYINKNDQEKCQRLLNLIDLSE